MNDIEMIADALREIGTHLKYLGNGDASTTMGAIEAHGKFTSEAIQTQAAAIGELAQSVCQASESLDEIAVALRDGLSKIAAAISREVPR
jgi:hypothetical protein